MQLLIEHIESVNVGKSHHIYIIKENYLYFYFTLYQQNINIFTYIFVQL